jgi:aldose 1-epimerase
MKIARCQVGPLELELIPALGAVIKSLTWNGIPILRTLPEGPAVMVNQGGCFALVPYSNRIAEGHFIYQDKAYQLRRNFGDHPHCIHGNAWQQHWQVTEQTDNSIEVSYLHDAKGENLEQWPWPYRVTQRFTLSDNHLEIQLCYKNLANKTVPVGLGFHPYFPRASESEIEFSAKNVLLNNSNSLPCALETVPENWNYQQWRKPDPGSIDNCFTNWDGCARVRWPIDKLMVTVSALNADHAILFIPPLERDFIAIEPVSHINNAINNSGFDQPHLAMDEISAGDLFSITMRLEACFYE